MNLSELLQETFCEAVAAAGFGVLFNVRLRSLPWCAISGAIALSVRETGLHLGWSLEASSFVAALAVGLAMRIIYSHTEVSQDALDVVGCIPMVPGSFAAKAILALFALTTPDAPGTAETLTTAAVYALRVLFTIGAIGTGLAIPTLFRRAQARR